jgi:proteasome lid subunit RPN8/RPN11
MKKKGKKQRIAEKMNIKIEKEILWKIFALTHDIKTENMGLLGGEIVDNTILITDLHIIKQSASMTSVEIDPEALSAWMVANPEKNEKLVGWYHSHNDMNTFFSGTDVGWIEKFLRYIPIVVSIVSARATDFPYLDMKMRVDVRIKMQDETILLNVIDGGLEFPLNIFDKSKLRMFIPDEIRDNLVEEEALIGDRYFKGCPTIYQGVHSTYSNNADGDSLVAPIEDFGSDYEPIDKTKICPICNRPFGFKISRLCLVDRSQYVHDECCTELCNLCSVAIELGCADGEEFEQSFEDKYGIPPTEREYELPSTDIEIKDEPAETEAIKEPEEEVKEELDKYGKKKPIDLGKNRYMCPYCDEIYTGVRAISCHINPRRNNNPNGCANYDKIQEKKIGKKRDLKPKKVGRKKWACPYCGKAVKGKKAVENHMKDCYAREN